MMMRILCLAAAAALLAPVAATAAETASDVRTVTLTLKGHRFTPQAIEVAAGSRVRIELINKDAATEEFDSDDLHVEEDVTPNGRTSFLIGPLQPGTYSFQGELHADTAGGTITAVAPAAP